MLAVNGGGFLSVAVISRGYISPLYMRRRFYRSADWAIYVCHNHNAGETFTV